MTWSNEDPRFSLPDLTHIGIVTNEPGGSRHPPTYRGQVSVEHSWCIFLNGGAPQAAEIIGEDGEWNPRWYWTPIPKEVSPPVVIEWEVTRGNLSQKESNDGK